MIRSAMDRAAAERLMSAALALDTPLGELDSAVWEIADEHERTAFVRALGDIFRLLNEGFIIPIGRTYPDLAPEIEALR
jgi:hypothetical protein